MKVVDAGSELHLGRRRIRLRRPGADDDFYDLAGWNFFRARKFDLYSPKAAQKFTNTFAKSRLGTALDLLVAEEGGPVILRITEDDGDRIPWEAVQALMSARYRRRLAPLRIVDPDSAGFTVVGAPMRCVILIGHPGGEGAFDPEAALAFLESTVTGAMVASGHDPAVLARQLRPDTFAQVAADIRAQGPNVVLYFGHGRQTGGPQLLLSENDWVPVRKVAELLFSPDVERAPFWIFWACSLAEGADGPTARMGAPGTLDALTSSGAVAMLAMRAKIGVATARPMLDALIGAFVSGEPLEVAAGYSRAAALEGEWQGTGRMDHAAPAVWSRSAPVAEIRWGDPAAAADSWAAVALLGGGGAAPEFQTGLAETNAEARGLAEAWRHPGRYFVTTAAGADPGRDPASRSQFLGAAAHLRRQGGRLVVPILMREGKTFDSRLRLWAGQAVKALDPRHGDRELTGALKEMSNDGLAGLPRLLNLPGAAVLLSEPPDRPSAWEVLAEAGPDTTVVLAGASVPQEAEAWTLDQLTPDPIAPAALDLLIAKAPLACAILGVIERPLLLSQVAQAAGVGDQQFMPLEPYFVRVGPRRILGERLRARIVETVPKAVVEQARAACVDLLSGEKLEVDFDALTEVCRQHLALNAPAKASQAINVAWAVSGAVWTRVQRLRLFDLITRSGPLRDDLDDGVLLNLCQAAVEAQDTHWVGEILGRMRPHDPEDNVLRFALLAECAKADAGSAMARETMFSHAVAAVEAAKAAGMQPLVLHQQVNFARLKQYFDHDDAAALELYEGILQALGDPPFADRSNAQLFAACSRNGAECLLDPAARPISPELRDRIDFMLQRALTAARAHGLVEVLGELQYTQARLAEAAGDIAAAAGLLQPLAHAAPGASYGLLRAISADRLYWVDLRRRQHSFEWAEFRRLNRRVDLYEHAWAGRVALKARLRAVRELLARGAAGDAELAQRLIAENRDRIARHQGLSGGEDARSAGLTEAASDLLAMPPGDSWPAFLGGPRAASLPPAWLELTAAQVWKEVT